MDCDLAIVGGGLAGAALGTALARAGARVIIFEREPQFRDRVRGEGMLPWGRVEARSIGIEPTLIARCAHEARWMTAPDGNRDLAATTPSGLGCLNFYHPAMQQCVLDLAGEAGAEIRRPVEVIHVDPGEPPRVVTRSSSGENSVKARLVVGADGRNSRVRTWAGLAIQRAPECMITAGTLYRGLRLPEDAVQFLLNPTMQRLMIIFPIGDRRFRTYVIFRSDSHAALSGERDRREFLDMSVEIGAAPDWFQGAEAIGPLASFSGADCWAESAYRDGIVLIGDAAAASDPSLGCGLSLTLRDVRVLRDHLLAEPDWAIASRAYAAEHDKYYVALRGIHDAWRALFFGTGGDADARRAQALPLINADPSRVIDFTAFGPEAPCDDIALSRFFGGA